MNKHQNKTSYRNKGFTLVELLVVLVLMVILLSLSVVGILSWQDYSQFKKENTSAETIFYAAQNQLTEYNVSGVYDEKIIKALKDIDGHKVADPTDKGPFEGQTILYGSEDSGDYYKWEPDSNPEGTAVWGNTPSSAGDEKYKYQGSIYYLSAERGDYDRYLAYLAGGRSDITGTLGDGKEATALLFDIISSYISDKSVLNGAIFVEFSPEAAQVFSVSYSDRNKSLTYDSSGTSIMDRSEDNRREKMIGYFAADSLSMPIVGRNRAVSSEVELRNKEVLELVIKGDSFKNEDEYLITIYNAKGEIVPDAKIAHFRIPVSDAADSLKDASKNPVELTMITADGSEKHVRIPVWKGVSETGTEELHIVLDAADPQAQSYLYAAGDSAFINTYSFYRFGFDMKDLREIACGVTDVSGGASLTDEVHSNIECPVFAYIKENVTEDIYDGKVEYGISNCRHLYNVRFVTDYKAETDEAENLFRLLDDIDWEKFKGQPDGTNYYLNSYRNGTDSYGNYYGIAFNGLDFSVNRLPESDSEEDRYLISDPLDTSYYAFPGFKVLSFGDIFTGKKKDADGCYTISNLCITYAANMAYGVYGSEAKDLWNSVGVSYSLSDYGKYTENEAGGETHQAHINAMKGLYPLGLFAENDGEISNLALNKHQVIGMEKLRSAADNADVLVYTNMVGGFAGNNLGKMSNLTLRDVNDLSSENTFDNEAGVTHINGKTDVGGILGRESWQIGNEAARLNSDNKKVAVTLKGLANYGKVTGMENVGGIVGRAHVIRDYSRNNDIPEFNARFIYYNDGYEMYGTFDMATGKLDPSSLNGKSLSGRNVLRETEITIEECINRGDVSGDELVYDNVIMLYDSTGTLNAGTYTFEPDNGTDMSNSYHRCANIGGIAGITMDGFYMDYNGVKSGKALIDDYDSSYAVILSKCNSYRLYTAEELEVLKSADGSSAFPDGNIKDRIQHDYYVGNLAGYARLTKVKDCGNAVDENVDSASYKSFVFGRNYVGGLFGCFDTSSLESEAKVDGRYNIVNDANVIGVMNVGGFAGGIGIGDDTQETFSFKHPSVNEGSQSSQIKGYYGDVAGILNTGAVLGIRRYYLDYNANINSLIGMQDNQISKGIKKDRVTESGPDSNVGGITGILRHGLKNADNIQSDATKEYILQLVGIDYGDDLQVELGDILAAEEYSYYGGNAVGGLVGKIQQGVDINKDIAAYSTVNAVVYGTDAVGGIYGGCNENMSSYELSNCLLDSALIMGHNMVGGIAGVNDIKINNSNTNTYSTQNKPYRVYGNYAVGGVAGISSYKNDGNYATVRLLPEDSGKIIVEGRAYAGGYAGVVTMPQPKIAKYITGVEVKADFFAGGTAGAVYNNDGNAKNTYFSSISAAESGRSDSVSVEAGFAFAGGFAGLYGHRNGGNSTNLITNPDNRFISSHHGNKVHPLLLLADELEGAVSGSGTVSYQDIIRILAENEEDGKPLNKGTADLAVKVLGFNANVLPGSGTGVKAGIFAGGVFGYIPNGFDLTFDIGGSSAAAIGPSVEATGSVSASDIAAILENNYEASSFMKDALPSSDQYGARSFSYAGGITGRVSEGLTILRASYNGNIKANGSYLGQIAEVNAGTVSASRVNSFASGVSPRDFTGGLVGLNDSGAVVSGDNRFVDNTSISGTKILGGLIGENRADMSFEDWTSWSQKSLTGNSVQLSMSSKDETAAGYIIGYNIAELDPAGIDVEAGTISNSCYAGVITGINAGNIRDSIVSGLVGREGLNITEEGLRFRIKEQQAGVSSKISLAAADVRCLGLISGINTGEISYICLDSSSVVSGSDITYFGGVTGQLADSENTVDEPAKLFKCFGFMPVTVSFGADYAAGSAGIAGGAALIESCDNHADISASDGAAGVLAWTDSSINDNDDEEHLISINDCVNTGNITVSSEGGFGAGIAAETAGEGDMELCRNYGKISGNIARGITARDAGRIHNCLEAGGLNENDGANPIGYTLSEDKGDLVRNFYIYGTASEIYSGGYISGGSGSGEGGTGGESGEGKAYQKISFDQNVLNLRDSDGSTPYTRTYFDWNAGPKVAVDNYILHGVNDYPIFATEYEDFNRNGQALHEFNSKIYAYFRSYGYDQNDINTFVKLLDYIMDNAKIPSKEEFIAYLSSNSSNSGQTVTMAVDVDDVSTAAFEIEFPDEVVNYRLSSGHMATDVYGWDTSQGGAKWYIRDIAQNYNGHPTSDEEWLRDIYRAYNNYKKVGNGHEEYFLNYVSYIYAAFRMVCDKNGVEYTLDGFIDYLSDVFETATLPGITNGGTTVPDESHWPVQLYVVSNAGSGSYTLTFKRYDKYISTGITSSYNMNPAEITDETVDGFRYTLFTAIDTSFKNMALNENDHPNNDDAAAEKQGFVKGN
ncbi:MAG: prepilin-type N-terminal cleavage/methylation domain-containing protein [Eubacterium sp.]|nr:prepilin-type N-terminal cleavage/methylation domain-containing protein [Eubacterium sp.]